MDCPRCAWIIDPEMLTVDTDAEEDGIEASFQCPECLGNFFAVLKTTDFMVDDSTD